MSSMIDARMCSTQAGRSVSLATANRSTCFCDHIWTVYKEAMEEGGALLKNMFKLVNASTFFATYFNPNLPSTVNDLATSTKNAKNMISFAEAPMRVEKLAKSISKFDGRDPVQSVVNVGNDLCGVVSTVVDSAELGNTFVAPVPKEAMKQMKLAGSVATLFSSVKGSVDTAKKVASNFFAIRSAEQEFDSNEISAAQLQSVKAKKNAQIISNILSLATKVTCVALGALGIAAFFTTVSPFAAVGLGALATVTGMGSYFYDRIVDPFDDRARKLAASPLFQRAQEIANG